MGVAEVNFVLFGNVMINTELIETVELVNREVGDMPYQVLIRFVSGAKMLHGYPTEDERLSGLNQLIGEVL